MSYRTKTLSLQRAYFNDGFNGDLEQTLRNLFVKLSKANERIVDIDFFARRLFANIEDDATSKGVFLRVLEFEKGAIGVINFDTTNDIVAVDEFHHPKHRDFLRDEAVLYVVGNHIVACNLKNKHGTLAGNVLTLAQSAEVLERGVTLKISDVPDKTTLDRLRTVGVKEVDIGVTSYIQNLDFLKSGSSFGKVVKSVFATPDDKDAIRKRANAVGKLSLRRGRFEKDELEKDQWLTEIGAEILEEGVSEDFKIRLEDGSTVSNSSLKKSKSVKLKRYANSFSYDGAKLELKNYFKALTLDGSLGA